MDYFHLRLFSLPLAEGNRYANAWEMHRFHRRYNDRHDIGVLRNKLTFRRAMSAVTAGSYSTVTSGDVMAWLGRMEGRRIVAKHPLGTAGRSVSIHRVDSSSAGVRLDGCSAEEGLSALSKQGQVLLEEYLVQHEVLNGIYSDSLNTVRVLTFINDLGEVEIWSALLRIGNGANVDNFHAGGITAQVNVDTGAVQGPLVLIDPFLPKLGDVHPLTSRPIVGVRLPFWEEGLELVRLAALQNPSIRTVGWDLALLEDGPAIIEGNDNWDKIQWQLGLGRPMGMRIRELLAKD